MRVAIARRDVAYARKNLRMPSSAMGVSRRFEGCLVIFAGPHYRPLADAQRLSDRREAHALPAHVYGPLAIEHPARPADAHAHAIHLPVTSLNERRV
jgi:hypothetical protein